MNSQNKIYENNNLLFSQNKINAPDIKISLLHAEHIHEIPLDHLNETVIVTDFDFTVKYPRFVANLGNAHREGANLRGGFDAFKIMKQIKEQAWGYYIASAASPSKFTAEAMVTEMKNIYIDDRIDISNLFVDHSPMTKSTEMNRNLFDHKGQLETFPRCYMYDNIILNNYDKAAGTILKIRTTHDIDKKISKIIFVDDFVVNAYFYPNDFINYLPNIADKLADSISIISVWLDPKAELAKNNFLQQIVMNGYENSFSKEYINYVDCFSENPEISMNFSEYINMTKPNTVSLKV